MWLWTPAKALRTFSLKNKKTLCWETKMKFMKKQFVTFVAVICLLMSVSLTGYAYSVKVKIAVPFEFNAGEAKLPPGTYQIERTSMQWVFSATNVETGEKIKFMASLVRPDNLSGFFSEGGTETKVTFKKVGNEMFLHEIIDAENGGRYKLNVQE